MKVSVVSDKEFVAKMRQKIKENDGYCPCALEKTPDTHCMCKEFCEMIENKVIGKCNCGLYEITDNE